MFPEGLRVGREDEILMRIITADRLGPAAARGESRL